MTPRYCFILAGKVMMASLVPFRDCCTPVSVGFGILAQKLSVGFNCGADLADFVFSADFDAVSWALSERPLNLRMAARVSLSGAFASAEARIEPLTASNLSTSISPQQSFGTPYQSGTLLSRW